MAKKVKIVLWFLKDEKNVVVEKWYYDYDKEEMNLSNLACYNLRGGEHPESLLLNML